MKPRLHSVSLDQDACKGCTNCLKRCPTEAIRVRSGKAVIYEERCVDCGECIRHCPYHAKKAKTNTLAILEGYDYCVALPAPSLYGQFDLQYSIDDIILGLLSMGFHDVFEVSTAAGLAAKVVRDYVNQPNLTLPLISSSCPGVLRLIQVRFPSLVDHLVPVLAPMEIAARLVRLKTKCRNLGKVGIFFISPCAGKMTDMLAPLGIAQSEVDGVIGFKDIYLPLKAKLHANSLEGKKSSNLVQEHRRTHSAGLSWGRVDGEGASMGIKRRVSVDGIEHVTKILEMVENGSLDSMEFIEAMACPAGCVGGPLVVENPFIARVRLLNREKEEAVEPVPESDHDHSAKNFENSWPDLMWEQTIEPRKGIALAPTLHRALELEAELENLAKELPALDCGSCGAPSCRALAEDTVRGLGTLDLCSISVKKVLDSDP